MKMQTFFCGRSQRDPEYRSVWIDDVIARSEKAALCVTGGRELWIPFSALEEVPTERGVAHVAAWLVRKESLIEHVGPDPLPHPGTSVAPVSDLGYVDSVAFGRGRLLRIEGDKSVVQFADRTRTMGSRYLKKVESP